MLVYCDFSKILKDGVMTIEDYNKGKKLNEGYVIPDFCQRGL